MASDVEGTGFAAIPRHLFGTLSAYELVVYAVLAYHADASGLCWPSHATIAREGGLSVKTIQRALNGLRDKGHVSWTPRVSESGGSSSNAYRVRMWDVPPASQRPTNKTHRTRAKEQQRASSSSSLRSSSSSALSEQELHDSGDCYCHPENRRD